MKPLPVIQPAAPAPPAPTELKTAGLVNDAARHAELEPKVRAAIKTVFDPEIPVNVYDLGLIYEIIVTAESVVGVRMTLTAPGLPRRAVAAGTGRAEGQGGRGRHRRPRGCGVRAAVDEGPDVRRGEAAAGTLVAPSTENLLLVRAGPTGL